MPARSQTLKAEELLENGELAVPDPVLRAERFLQELGIWYRLGRNGPATSCRDAAQRRRRLGSTGIPLWDELKTLAFRGSSGGLVLVHCRGDERLDDAQVAEALSEVASSDTFMSASTEELEALGLGYGLVNPFQSWDAVIPVRHVFDSDLRERIGVPGTLMTNAGDRTWSVEFYVDELIESLEGTRVRAITDRNESSRPAFTRQRAMLGIVTGNGPESGMALLQSTIDEVRTRLGRLNLGDISLPPVQLASVPEMGLSMELSERVEAVEGALTTAVEKLCRDGCTLIAVACNTTQYFTPALRAICDQYGATFVSLPEVVAAWLRAHAIDSVGLVGIRYVSDLGEWSAYGPALAGIDVEIPSRRGMGRIEEIAYLVKASGADRATLARYKNVLRDELRQSLRSSHVVLALTELSVLLDLPDTGKPGHDKVLIDPLHLYAEALACAYLGMPFPSSPAA